MEEGKELKPTVSIVVPVRNGEFTIGTLLDSLLNVNYDKKVEVVVVDGNSTDRTRDIVGKYPFKLVIEMKKGLNVARNTGIRNSSGEIIAFTDCDCFVPNDWVGKIVNNFEDPRVGCVSGNVTGFHDDFLSQYADNSVVPVMRVFKKREELDMIKLLLRFPAGCNMAFKRKVLEEVGGFDETIHYSFDEDELVERVCRAGYKMVLDPNVLILHKHRSSLRELLKQTFRYGRGVGLVLKRKRVKDTLSTWSLMSLLSFMAVMSVIGSLIFLTLTTSLKIFPQLLVIFMIVPLFGLMAFYSYKVLENKRYDRIIIYPLIDILRALTFCIGEIYQLFRLE